MAAPRKYRDGANGGKPGRKGLTPKRIAAFARRDLSRCPDSGHSAHPKGPHADGSCATECWHCLNRSKVAAVNQTERGRDLATRMALAGLSRASGSEEGTRPAQKGRPIPAAPAFAEKLQVAIPRMNPSPPKDGR